MTGQEAEADGEARLPISDAELYALAGMSSASSALFERRRRILREAQHMLAEEGVGGFSTMELSRRTGVAQRTIFNAFGNRDTLIALAIRVYFEQLSLAIGERFDPLTLDGALGRMATTFLRNAQIRNYMAALVTLHFSPSAPAPCGKSRSTSAAGSSCPGSRS